MTGTADPPSLRAYRPRVFPDLRRYGNACDGGYVIPRSIIDASDCLLSLGVEADWSFEEAVRAAKPSIRITCVDGTSGPEQIAARLRRDLSKAARQMRVAKFLRLWRERHKPEQFRAFFAVHEFLPLMVAARIGPGTTTLPDLINHVRAGDPGRRVFVKIDIEGAEYDVLAQSRGQWEGITGFAIEFHGLGSRWQQFRCSMDALCERFFVAHVHGNNNDGYVPGTGVPQTLEVTFASRGLYAMVPPPSMTTYPIPGLDAPNRIRRPDMPIRFD